jgi:hypothetical protein
MLWAAERDAAGSPSLPRAYRRLMQRQLCIGVAWGTLQGVLSTVLRPIVLQLLIRSLSSESLTAGGAYCNESPEEVQCGGAVRRCVLIDDVRTEAALVILAFSAVSLGDNFSRAFASQTVRAHRGG